MKIAAAAVGFGVALAGTYAFAYRPFDDTDAAVADLGGIELEIGAAQWERAGRARLLTTPAAVINFGIAPRWEAVLEGAVISNLAPPPARTSLGEDALSLKGVLREGVLQDKPGPSVATEISALMPGIDGDPGAGARLDGIVSYRWGWLTVHVNAAAGLTRDHHADFFVGSIFEGPRDWPVRPVAEIFGDREPGAFAALSGLIGAIWQVKETVAVDFAVRDAVVSHHTVNEVRAGVTFGLPLWSR